MEPECGRGVTPPVSLFAAPRGAGGYATLAESPIRGGEKARLKMEAEYDRIAEQYRDAKLQPWRLHLEVYTFLQLVGDLSGKAVLDLACGEGFYSRILKRHGAARVVGVDLSARMIELARAEEAREPLGIEYRVGDAR